MTGTACAVLAYVAAIVLMVGYAAQLWWQLKREDRPAPDRSSAPRS